MRVARFWARASAGDDGYQRGAWGSSDTSLDEAMDTAICLAEQRRAEVLAADDWGLHQYEYERHDMPEPIVRDVHNQDGDRIAAVTINRYGARVLNTARLAFVDVDLEPPAPAPGFIGRLLGRRAPATDGAERAIARLREWAGNGSGNGARVYRTAAGLRYLLTSPAMEPTSDETKQLMATLGADPLYARLCNAQRSFRARLSPKPWRLGIRGTPKLTYEKLAEASEPVNEWLRNYEQACKGYSVCDLIDQVGNTRPPDDDTARLITLHDDLAGVDSKLPLA